MDPLPVDAATDPEEEAGLWAELACGRGADARTRLIEMHLPFARIMAAKLYAGRYHDEIEFAEYMQFATVGLIECVDRYDLSHGATFRTYAARRIEGAILNGLESASERHEQAAFRRRLRKDRLDSLRDEAAASGTAALFESLARVAVGLALGYILEDSGMFSDGDRPGADDTYRSLELKQLGSRVRALVDELPERERKVIRYHYLQAVPFEAIAAMLGVTKGRVSQLHRRAMDRLRDETRKVRRCDIAW
jgi:RNA polymerase sigma factor for flagellar operon FliA